MTSSPLEPPHRLSEPRLDDPLRSPSERRALGRGAAETARREAQAQAEALAEPAAVAAGEWPTRRMGSRAKPRGRL